jgi:predicted TIM-barrel fold metal-dependent hydrolase
MRTVVHVQAGWHAKDPLGSVDETRWINSLPFGGDGAPTLGAIVVQADPSTPGIGDLLDAHLRATPLVRGVRCMAAHHDDRGVMNWTQAAHLLTQPAFLRGFEAVAERGLSFDIWVYGHQLPDAVTLAR